MTASPFGFTIKQADDSERSTPYTVSDSLDTPGVHPGASESHTDLDARIESLMLWAGASSLRAGVTLAEWKEAVRIILVTFGAAPGILADLGDRNLFWQALVKIGWESPEDNPENPG